jgi:hypothetical protein
VIGYEIVVLDPEQFTSMVQMLMSGCSGNHAIAAPFAKQMVD